MSAASKALLNKIKQLCELGRGEEALEYYAKLKAFDPATSHLSYERKITKSLIHLLSFAEDKVDHPGLPFVESLSALLVKPLVLPAGVALFPVVDHDHVSTIFAIQVGWTSSMKSKYSFDEHGDSHRHVIKAKELVLREFAPRYFSIAEQFSYRIIPDVEAVEKSIIGDSLGFAALAAWASFVLHKPLSAGQSIFSGSFSKRILDPVSQETIKPKLTAVMKSNSKLVIHQDQELPGLSEDETKAIIRISTVEDLFDFILPQVRKLRLGDHTAINHQELELSETDRDVISLIEHAWDKEMSLAELQALHNEVGFLERLEELIQHRYLAKAPNDHIRIGDHSALHFTTTNLNEERDAHNRHLEFWLKGDQALRVVQSPLRVFYHSLCLNQPNLVKTFCEIIDGPNISHLDLITRLEGINRHHKPTVSELYNDFTHFVKEDCTPKYQQVLIAWSLYRCPIKGLRDLGERLLIIDQKFDCFMTLKHLFYVVLNYTVNLAEQHGVMSSRTPAQTVRHRLTMGVLIERLAGIKLHYNLSPELYEFLNSLNAFQPPEQTEERALIEIFNHFSARTLDKLKFDEVFSNESYTLTLKQCTNLILKFTNIDELSFKESIENGSASSATSDQHIKLKESYLHFQDSPYKSYFIRTGTNRLFESQQSAAELSEISFASLASIPLAYALEDFPTPIAKGVKRTQDKRNQLLSVSQGYTPNQTEVFKAALELLIALRAVTNTTVRLSLFALLSQLDESKYPEIWSGTNPWYQSANTLNVSRVFSQVFQRHFTKDLLSINQKLHKLVTSIESLEVLLRWFIYQPSPLEEEMSYKESILRLSYELEVLLTQSLWYQDCRLIIMMPDIGPSSAEGFIHSEEISEQLKQLKPTDFKVLNSDDQNGDCLLLDRDGVKLDLSPWLRFENDQLWLFRKINSSTREQLKSGQARIGTLDRQYSRRQLNGEQRSLKVMRG